MNLKLSYKLFFGIFMTLIATFLLCFVIVDRLLLDQYEQAYRIRLEALIQDLGAQLETMRLPEVDELMNHFAFENHANISVTTHIKDPSLFDTFTNFEHIPIDILFNPYYELVFDSEMGEWLYSDDLPEGWQPTLAGEDGYYLRTETLPEMALIPDTHRFFITDPLWNIVASFETVEGLATFTEDVEEGAYTFIVTDDERNLIATTQTISDLVSFLDFKDFPTDATRSFNHLFLFGVEDANVMTQTFHFPNVDANVNHQLTIEMSFAPATHIINELRHMAMPLLVAVICLSFFIALFFAFYLSRPIVHISQISHKMSDLDLTQRTKVGRRDEIGQLARNLNSMADNLETFMRNLTDANAKLTLQMSQKEEQEKMRKDFFMAVSHELKTPLMILKTQLSGMIERIGIYKDRDLYLNRAQETTDNMTELVNSLLKITQLNATDMKLDLAFVDLAEIIQQICQNYEHLASDKGISLTHFCEKNTIVNLDKSQITTALSNIIANAIIHTNKGELVDIQLQHFDNNTAVLKVENYGAKINAEDLPHLFEPFHRTDKSRNRYTGGSGIGLYLVKSILDLHGFSYELRNSANGVVFELTFPTS